MSDLFKGVDVHKDNAQVTLKCAFLEIHNEEVRDLLHPESDPKSIAIRERGDGAHQFCILSSFSADLYL